MWKLVVVLEQVQAPHEVAEHVRHSKRTRDLAQRLAGEGKDAYAAVRLVADIQLLANDSHPMQSTTLKVAKRQARLERARVQRDDPLSFLHPLHREERTNRGESETEEREWRGWSARCYHGVVRHPIRSNVTATAEDAAVARCEAPRRLVTAVQGERLAVGARVENCVHVDDDAHPVSTSTSAHPSCGGKAEPLVIQSDDVVHVCIMRHQHGRAHLPPQPTTYRIRRPPLGMPRAAHAPRLAVLDIKQGHYGRQQIDE
mmetsp:Transcript_4470/g.14364  ORF Transcript_4470/g.14364 Transcript_4470/m.14364 type:complete len:258 (+) Transcript_4470:547-1320(+)